LPRVVWPRAFSLCIRLAWRAAARRCMRASRALALAPSSATAAAAAAPASALPPPPLSIVRSAAATAAAAQGLPDIARHVIGCHTSQV